MRSIIKLLLAAILVSGSAFSFAGTHKNTEILQEKTEDRHLSGFNGVNLGGSFDVYVTQGPTESVKVEAPADVIGHIVTEVSGGVLNIYNKNDHFHWGDFFGNHRKIVIYVTAKDLNSITVSGSGDMFFREGINTNSLRVKVSGSGDLVGKITVKSLECGVSGSGDIKLSGHADNAVISVSGSGDFSGRNLSTSTTAVRVSGSGDADVNASERLDAHVSGSGDIRYTGGAKSVNSSKSGSGDISRF